MFNCTPRNMQTFPQYLNDDCDAPARVPLVQGSKRYAFPPRHFTTSISDPAHYRSTRLVFLFTAHMHYCFGTRMLSRRQKQASIINKDVDHPASRHGACTSILLVTMSNVSVPFLLVFIVSISSSKFGECWFISQTARCGQ